MFTAIAEAESGFDFNVINDTPATGDYSVGNWQVNYYGNLYAGRAAQFGTPADLINGGIAPQAAAAVQIWREQGYGAWSTWTSGAYRQFLGSAPAPPPAVAPGQQTVPVATGINAPTEDYSATVAGAAALLAQSNQNIQDFWTALNHLGDGNPHG